MTITIESYEDYVSWIQNQEQEEHHREQCQATSAAAAMLMSNAPIQEVRPDEDHDTIVDEIDFLDDHHVTFLGF